MLWVEQGRGVRALASYASFMNFTAFDSLQLLRAMDGAVSLSFCFQLGRALRFSDADTFLALYDSLILDGPAEQDQQV